MTADMPHNTLRHPCASLCVSAAIRHYSFNRFMVHALERKAHSRGAGQPADRVSVNFLPSAFTLETI
jgi:hypothetical protein